MKHLLSIFASLLALSISAQTFYDLNTVQKIEITFSQSNWDQLLDNQKATTEDYIMAQSVTINGEVFDSVGVKYKGNSTYKSNQTKNPFHIELDTYKDHIYENYTDIKLSNVANDPSFVREVLSYQILRQYMDAPLSNYANVYVNGTLIGLYSNSEAITKKFLSSRFNSKKNTFIKCNPIDGAGPTSTDLPNLEYLGTDSSNYNKAYELKSDFGWSHLINLCDTLKNQIGNIEDVLDVDRALWMLAFNNVLVNLDSYSGGFAQNYYLYKSDYDQFIPVVWDLNESFGRFAMTGSGNLNSTTQKQQMSHLLHENDADYPLISQLMSNPMYKRMYIAHMKTMLLENFDNGSYYTTGQSLQSTIDSDVQNDQNKFFTYANFTSNLSSDITSGGGGPGGGSTPGIKSLMDGRSTYLLNQSDFQKTAPTISNISLSNSNPSIGDKIFVTADISNANGVYIGYRYDSNSPFTRTSMFDDGNNGDGASGDGKYGFEITVSSSAVEYYIYSENSDAGIFSPVRAEYEYHVISTTGSLVINEFGASNSSVVKNDLGGYSDWIELYNNSSANISLNGYYLSDDLSDTMTYKFPNVDIKAGEYLMIWASGDSTLGEYHADFKLSASGEEVVLFYDNGNDIQMIDYVSYSSQTTNYSYGRVSDGATDWQVFKTPTPNATNIDTWTSVDESDFSEFKVFPNPYNGQINIVNPNGEVAQLKIFDLKGQLLHSSSLGAFESITWKEMDQAKGMRIILLETASTQKVYKVISQ